MARTVQKLRFYAKALSVVGSKAFFSVALLSVLVNYFSYWSPETPCFSCTVSATYSRFRAPSANPHVASVAKTGPPRTLRSPKSQSMADNSGSEVFSKPPASPTLNGASGDPSQLNGVDGDIKQAFGNQVASKNLRDDLLMAADNVTNAMFSLVKELNSDDDISAAPDLGFMNGDSDTADLEALERQVNQIRQSIGASEEMEQGHVNLPNGDVTMTDVSGKVISHGREKRSARGRMGLGKLGGRRADGERTDTDTDDDEVLVRNGYYKCPSVQTPMTDDESYIQTDDDEGTGRTDDEDQEWQDSMRRWANR